MSATIGYGIVTRPMAAHPFKSYRYHGRYGHIAIGAMTDDEALNEAQRSMQFPAIAAPEQLDRWDGEKYVAVKP